MREALAVVAEEGLDHLWQRHGNCAQMLWGGLTSMGLEPLVENEADRLVTVNTIKVARLTRTLTASVLHCPLPSCPFSFPFLFPLLPLDWAGGTDTHRHKSSISPNTSTMCFRHLLARPCALQRRQQGQLAFVLGPCHC